MMNDVEVAEAPQWCALGDGLGEVFRNDVFPDAIVVGQILQVVAGGRDTGEVYWREVAENVVHELSRQLEQQRYLLGVLHGRRSSVLSAGEKLESGVRELCNALKQAILRSIMQSCRQ